MFGVSEEFGGVEKLQGEYSGACQETQQTLVRSAREGRQAVPYFVVRWNKNSFPQTHQNCKNLT